MPELTQPRIASQPESTVDRLHRRAAAGKALIVWLATGSVGAAIVAFVLFKMMGC